MARQADAPQCRAGGRLVRFDSELEGLFLVDRVPPRRYPRGALPGRAAADRFNRGEHGHAAERACIRGAGAHRAGSGPLGRAFHRLQRVRGHPRAGDPRPGQDEADAGLLGRPAGRGGRKLQARPPGPDPRAGDGHRLCRGRAAEGLPPRADGEARRGDLPRRRGQYLPRLGDDARPEDLQAEHRQLRPADGRRPPGADRQARRRAHRRRRRLAMGAGPPRRPRDEGHALHHASVRRPGVPAVRGNRGGELDEPPARAAGLPEDR